MADPGPVDLREMEEEEAKETAEEETAEADKTGEMTKGRRSKFPTRTGRPAS